MHRQSREALSGRVVQVARETPSFLILQVEQLAGETSILFFALARLFRHRVCLCGTGGQLFIGGPQLAHEIVEFLPGPRRVRVGFVRQVLRVNRRDDQPLVRFPHLPHQPLDFRALAFGSHLRRCAAHLVVTMARGRVVRRLPRAATRRLPRMRRV
jgi:hypothetical protein